MHNTIRILERTIEILHLLSRSDAGLSVGQLSKVVELPRSTLYRIVNTLLASKIIQKEKGGLLRLGPTLVSMVRAVSKENLHFGLVAAATPVLEQLRNRLLEATKLSVLDRDEAEVVVAFLGLHEYSPTPAVGHRYPLHAGAASKLILAHMASRELTEYLRRPLVRYTTKTITSPELLASELAKIRALGFAQDDGEHNSSVFALAVPVFGDGEFRAALSVPFIGEKSDADRHAILSALLLAAREIGDRISDSPDGDDLKEVAAVSIY